MSDRSGWPMYRPGEVIGEIMSWAISGQSTSRTRLTIPGEGAKSFRLYYTADRIAGDEDATGIALKIVFGTQGGQKTTAQADGDLAVAYEDGSSGGDLDVVNYVVVPINSGIERSFPDTDDLLLTIDFVTVAAESGGSTIYAEATV